MSNVRGCFAVVEELEEEEKRFEFLNMMFAGINKEQRCVYDAVVFFEKNCEIDATQSTIFRSLHPLKKSRNQSGEIFFACQLSSVRKTC